MAVNAATPGRIRPASAPRSAAGMPGCILSGCTRRPQGGGQSAVAERVQLHHNCRPQPERVGLSPFILKLGKCLTIQSLPPVYERPPRLLAACSSLTNATGIGGLVIVVKNQQYGTRSLSAYIRPHTTAVGVGRLSFGNSERPTYSSITLPAGSTRGCGGRLAGPTRLL